MNVAIEARVLSAPGGGVRRYVVELLQALSDRFPETQLTAIRGQAGPVMPGIAELIVPLRHELLLPLWLNYQVPRVLNQGGYSVTHFTKAAIPRRPPRGTVVTIYDIIPLLYPAGQTWLRRHYWPAALRHAAQRSEHIMTISHASRRDIINRFQLSPEKVTATPLAASGTFSRVTDEATGAALRNKYRLTQPFMLYVGRFEPRKNVPALIRAYSAIASQIPHDLVLAGSTSWGEAEVASARAASPYADRIKLLGTITAADLPALYSAADVFVWPSIYEGWGLPPLEALACGTPVIVSSGDPLPEVVGTVGTIVPFSSTDLITRTTDAEFDDALGRAMLKVLSTPDTDDARQARIAHARSFSWAAVAETTWRVYERVHAHYYG